MFNTAPHSRLLSPRTWLGWSNTGGTMFNTAPHSCLLSSRTCVGWSNTGGTMSNTAPHSCLLSLRTWSGRSITGGTMFNTASENRKLQSVSKRWIAWYKFSTITIRDVKTHVPLGKAIGSRAITFDIYLWYLSIEIYTRFSGHKTLGAQNIGHFIVLIMCR